MCFVLVQPQRELDGQIWFQNKTLTIFFFFFQEKYWNIPLKSAFVFSGSTTKEWGGGCSLVIQTLKGVVGTLIFPNEMVVVPSLFLELLSTYLSIFLSSYVYLAIYIFLPPPPWTSPWGGSPLTFPLTFINIYISIYASIYLSMYSWINIKGTWSVHLFNGDYLSIPEGTGSCWCLFHEIPGTYWEQKTRRQKNALNYEGSKANQKVNMYIV